MSDRIFQSLDVPVSVFLMVRKDNHKVTYRGCNRPQGICMSDKSHQTGLDRCRIHHPPAYPNPTTQWHSTV